MKVMIEVGNFYLGLEAGKDVGVILSAMDGATVYDREWSGDYRWKPAGTAENPKTVRIELVPDSALSPATPIMESMAEEIKRANASWVEHYTRANKAEAELKELKAKVSTLSPEKEQHA